MTATTNDSNTRAKLAQAVLSLTKTQQAIAEIKEYYAARNFTLPPEVLVIERLTVTAGTIFELLPRTDYTLEGLLRLLEADVASQLKQAVDRADRVKATWTN